MRARDDAAAEVIGALIIFGIFVASIAVLNVTAVPSAGLAAEQEHHEATLGGLNALQSEAETAGLPGNVGSTVARSIELSPPRTVGQDFFSFFLATPARASGELTFDPASGGVRVHHTTDGGGSFNDIGHASEAFPLGSLTFDGHPIFREPGFVRLENGAIVAAEGEDEAMRFDPPITLAYDAATKVTNVSIKVRALAGDAFSIGGIAPVRATLTTQAATLASPVHPNSATATMEIQTPHPAAWAEFLERACDPLDALDDAYCAVATAGDTVTWTVLGADVGNDIRLSTGLAIYEVDIS